MMIQIPSIYIQATAPIKGVATVSLELHRLLSSSQSVNIKTTKQTGDVKLLYGTREPWPKETQLTNCSYICV